MSSGGGGGGSKDAAEVSPPKRTCVESTSTVTLILSDGILQVDRNIAIKAAMIKAAVGENVPAEDGDGSGSEDEDAETTEVPLPTVTMAMMKTLVGFLVHHETNPYTPVPKPLPSKNLEDLVKDKFDLALVTKPDDEDIRAFIQRMSRLLSTAEYLGIDPLVKLCMLPFAVRIKGVQQSQVLINFGLDPNTTFTKEDEEKILRAYPWLQTDM